MTRISNEEAQNYVPYERTLLSPSPTYFSIFIDNEGWEVVKYYTSRLIKEEKIKKESFNFTKEEAIKVIESLGSTLD